MSAAFSLDYSGDPVPCDFPGCVRECFHDGDHEFAAQKVQWNYDRHCVVCGVPFMIIGPIDKNYPADTCGSEACLLHYARRWSCATAPLICRCPQRDYPHELSVHALIRSEWWRKELRGAWPWSLMASVREEPSTERQAR